MIVHFLLPLLFSLVLSQTTKILTLENSIFTFSRELIGIGFIKQLHTQIIMKNPTEKASITLTEFIPYKWWIDKEDIPKSLNPEFNSLIDTESPSSDSTNHTFTINIEFYGKYEFSYPIHMRYDDPSYDVLYKTISLPGPQIQYNQGQVFTVNGEFQAQVPVGQIKHIPIVVMGTILFELIVVCAIIFAANKFTHHISK
ncbi:unnamed protein product [Blepharisma stoltei]|uniref:Protein PBN1 n=1 Tax=Blepharisma stoltei TaxID=1481888 RepID=A0AAU9JMH0_9CILI|nr:unnamed protein product [Blepharisma stoltei]